MNLEMKYESKDVWGQMQLRDDWRYNANCIDLTAAFREMKKNHTAALVDVERSIIIGWDSYNDFQQGIVNERRYQKYTRSYTDIKKPFEQVKREWRRRLNREMNREMKGGETK